jgi:hypothetical protein
MKALKIAVLGLFLALRLAGVAHAGSSNGGRVVHVAAIGDVILFTVGGAAQSNRPACANTGRFTVHKNSPHAQLIMLAFAKGSTLGSVMGFGTCTLVSNSEDLQWIEVCPIAGC